MVAVAMDMAVVEAMKAVTVMARYNVLDMAVVTVHW